MINPKKITVLLSFIAISVLCGCLYPSRSESSEPKSFRGITWGTNISKLSGMKLFKKVNEDYKYYKRKGDKMKIGKVELSVVTYAFYKGQFFRVLILSHPNSTNAFSKLVTTLTAAYGDSDTYYNGNVIWEGNTTTVYLKDGALSSLIYWYNPIQHKMEVDDEKSAKSGKNDL